MTRPGNPAGDGRSERRFRALLVDYGGVMTTSITASFAEFCLSTGVSPERLKLVLAAAYRGERDDAVEEGLEDLVPAVETGRMAVEEFNDRLAVVLSEGLDRPVEALDLSARLFGGAVPDERMIAAVRSARSRGIKTALVSNTWGLKDSPPWNNETFDAVVLSGREGVRKPEREIYRLAAGRVGEEPASCIFVDDIAANIEGARDVGMTGILHRHPELTIAKLGELLGVELP
jgi:epoxide hydrolase-like predicted phosphatase